MSDTKQLPQPDSKPKDDRSRRLPGLVYTEDLLHQAARVEKWADRERRKTKRINRFLAGYSILITFLFIALSVSLTYAIPLIRILPVYFYSRSDGVMEAALTTDSFPTKDWGDMAIQTFLWRYVQSREQYSWQEQDINNYIVQAMSSNPVRELYQKWSSGKNPQSHLVLLGRKGVIRIEMQDVLNYHPSVDGQPGSITFHYLQQVHTEGEPDQKPKAYTVTLEFIKDYATGFDMKFIIQHNPFRIVITAYPGPYPLSAAQGQQ